MRLKGKGTSQKKKRCVKSTAYPCGFACINIKDKCHNVLHGQAKTYALWLGKTEERLAKINAHRSARGKDRIGLVENKGLSKLPRERSPLVEGILSGKVEPIATTELGKAAKALFKKDQEIKQKLADMEARSKEALRKIERQSSKNDYAFTDNPKTNKALDKALRGNDVALNRFIKRLKETDLDTAVSEVLSQKAPGKQTGSVDELAARRKTQQQPDNVVPFGKKETEKGNPDLVPKPPVKSKSDNVRAIGNQKNVEDISNARFNSKLKKGDVVGAIDDAIRTSNEASEIAKKGIADLERSQSEMEQKFDEVRAKYRLLGEPDPEADAAQARIDARKKAKEDELKAKVVPIGKKEKVKSGDFLRQATSIKYVDTVALKPGKQSVDSKIVDDLVKTHSEVGGYIRPMILSSEKPSWASDSFTVIKGNEQAIAAQKALKQNDSLEMTQAIIISEYPKSIQEGMQRQLNLLQGLQREIPTANQEERFFYDKKKQGKGLDILMKDSFIDVVSTKVEGVKNVDKKLVTDLANSFIESGGNINPIIVRRTAPDTFEVVSGKLEFLAVQKAMEIDDNLAMFKGIIINNENAHGIIEQTKLFNTIEKNSAKKANPSSSRPPTSPPSAKSKPTREQLIAEENRLGKELDIILNKYPGRRTPEQQREIDAKQAEYRAANRAIRGFNGGKSTDFSEQRSLYRNYRN